MPQLPIERHPLAPFLPESTKVLFLGSFPPKKERWCMDFFYPNFQNDMWRIMGYLFFSDKHYFVDGSARRFSRDKIADFCSQKGIALFDTSVAVIRHRDNASDKFLETVETVDLERLLARVPHCSAIAATGEKAADTLCAMVGVSSPKVGEQTPAVFAGRELALWRMPSSSRAYPIAVEKKAESYRRIFSDLGML